MQAASNDARGSGMGYRNTRDEWRNKLALAWAVAHRRVYKWEPTDSDYYNAGLTPPVGVPLKLSEEFVLPAAAGWMPTPGMRTTDEGSTREKRKQPQRRSSLD